MVRRTAILIALPLALAAGCGNSRTRVPDPANPATPTRLQTVTYRRAGVSLRVPSNWLSAAQRPPLVGVVISGAAVVALWRFTNAQPLPSSAAALARARSALIAAAKARDRSFQLIRTSFVTVDGRHAIELDAFEHVAGQPRRVRSTHVYAYGAEIVLDEYAPAGIFHPVDHMVFSPLKRSLVLFRPAAGS